MKQRIDARTVTFHIPQKEYGELLDYAHKNRYKSVESVILWALHCATDRIGLTSEDYMDILKEMRKNESRINK